jgi:catechol 2,3-dioxygenase-like lactoylglutathione lyase family enzyme
VIGMLSGIALECRDPKEMARFYGTITGWPVVFSSDDWVSIGGERSTWHLSFQRSPGHEPPKWPDETSSMQFHLHFRVADLQAAEEAVAALGGTKLGGDTGFTVFADPAGHPFCLVS